jgi:arylsulfatase A-like enzyme/Flp pilus assembly protein TadD
VRARTAVACVAVAAVLGGAFVFRDRLTRALAPRPRNLLVVTIDTLRADRVGVYGHAAARTPRLDSLAASGLRFARAATVTPLTLPAHSSLFTGSFPARHAVRDNGGYYLAEAHVTLAEVLRDRGYRTGGFVSSFVLDSRWGIAQGFDRYFDEFDLSGVKQMAGMDAIQRPGAETVDAAVRWLGEEDERPFFLWVHLYDPHTPYAAPADWARQFPRSMAGAYDAEIAYADFQLGRVLDALGDRRGETVIAVLGDHGEMLGEHGEQTHGFFVYDAAVRIPMVIAGPGLPARVIEDQVRIVDVMPTVLEALGAAAPPVVQGASLLAAARGERLALLAMAESWYPRFHYGWSELVAVQDGRYKLIRAPRRELFDLRADPGERNDLAQADPARADALARALEEMSARLGTSTAPAAPAALDADTAERLQALGYIGGGVSARHLEDRPRGDPKDKIGLYNLLKEASTAAAAGQTDQAIGLVRRALAEDAEILEGHMLLGNFLVRAGRREEAVESYKRALALDPEHTETTFRLATAYKEMGRAADARVGFQRAAELDPKSGRPVLQLADLDLRERRFADAEARLRKAMEGEVDRPRFLVKLGEVYIEMGRWADASRALEEAVEGNAKLETAHFNLGLVREEEGRADQAVAEYRRELEVNPAGYRAAFNLAKLLQRRGERAEAAALFQKAVTLSPDFAIGRLYLAKALLDAGDLAGAEREARAGLAGRPDPKLAPLGHFVLADVYNRSGRFADARREQAAGERLARAR